MKVKVSFELNLDDTRWNIDTIRDIPLSIFNLSDLLSTALSAKMEYRMSILARPEDALKTALLNLCDEDIQLLRSMFDNVFEVSGTTEDGHTFQFTERYPTSSTLVIDEVSKEEPGIMYTGKFLDELRAEATELRYE